MQTKAFGAEFADGTPTSALLLVYFKQAQTGFRDTATQVQHLDRELTSLHRDSQALGGKGSLGGRCAGTMRGNGRRLEPFLQAA